MATTLRAGHTGQSAMVGRSYMRRPRRVQRGVARTVLEVIALGTIAALLIAAPLISRTNAGHFETGTVLTGRGDTLWTIAREHPVPGLPTVQAVDVIARLNALEGSTIPAGTVLDVPVAAEKVAFALK